MTAPAQAEPAFLTAARNITQAMVSCSCGASTGERCFGLGGHVHWCRVSRARCQQPLIMTHELFCDALNYVLGRNDDQLTEQSDV